MSDKCPKCGADRTQKTSLHVKYACGSCDLLERRDLDLPASFLEGVDCKDRQIAALTARVKKLEYIATTINNRVMPFTKMVAEGGDWHTAGYWVIDHICHDGPPDDLEDIHSELDRILAAKEAEHE